MSKRRWRPLEVFLIAVAHIDGEVISFLIVCHGGRGINVDVELLPLTARLAIGGKGDWSIRAMKSLAATVGKDR